MKSASSFRLASKMDGIPTGSPRRSAVHQIPFETRSNVALSPFTVALFIVIRLKPDKPPTRKTARLAAVTMIFLTRVPSSFM